MVDRKNNHDPDQMKGDWADHFRELIDHQESGFSAVVVQVSGPVAQLIGGSMMSSLLEGLMCGQDLLRERIDGDAVQITAG